MPKLNKRCREEHAPVCSIVPPGAPSGELLRTFSEGSARDAEVFPSGDRVLTWGLDWATVWDVASGEAVCRLRGHYIPIIDAATLLPDGDSAVCVTRGARPFEGKYGFQVAFLRSV